VALQDALDADDKFVGLRVAAQVVVFALLLDGLQNVLFGSEQVGGLLSYGFVLISHNRIGRGYETA